MSDMRDEIFEKNAQIIFTILIVLLYVTVAFLGEGCSVPAVLTDEDWARLEKTVRPTMTEEDWQAFKEDLEDRTLTPEEFERWKEEFAKDVSETLKDVVDVTPAPSPVKEPVKDILEYLTYTLVAAWLGGKGLKEGVSKVQSKKRKR